MNSVVLLLVLHTIDIWTQTLLMHIEINMIHDYGYRFNFLQQRVGDDKLEQKCDWLKNNFILDTWIIWCHFLDLVTLEDNSVASMKSVLQK